jgi:hypothetical protein
MELDELAMRLSALEGADADRMAAEEQRGFIDKYGTMFSGDEGIGMAILAEMNRRGVPSAAVGADRVVQEILDQIRQEATMVLDKIKADRETVTNLMDQVQEIQEAVNAATNGETPLETAPELPPSGDMIPPPMEGELPPEGALPPDGGMPPPDMGALPPGGTPPIDVPGPGAPMAGELPPPGDITPPPGGELPPPPIPPIPSDVRVKRNISVKPMVQEKKTWKPGAHLLSAATRGKTDG